MRRIFRPEFLNRIDEIVAFNPLTIRELKAIVEMQLSRTNEKLKERNINITFEEDVKTFIINKGYDPVYGARPLKRAIQKYIENPLAAFLIRNDIEKGDIISYMDKGSVNFKLK
jgi:ATP-dependent Clp protease ATP-binding subunit ClpA